ncbi:MAG: CHASE2 domain-containing serine/threonine-protein kinase [Acidiferrobacterales bacterium]
MTKGGFFKKDWFAALVLGIVFIIAVLSGIPLIGNLEYLAYDTGVKLTNRSPRGADDIALVTIDDNSIRRIGRWPWPRNVLGDVITKLSQAQAKVIALQIFLSEGQQDPGLAYINQINDILDKPHKHPVPPAEIGAIRTVLQEAQKNLDTDSELAQDLSQTKGVVLPMIFQLGTPVGRPDAALPAYITGNRLNRIIAPANEFTTPPSGVAVTTPLAQFAQYAAGIGHLNLIADRDGAVRTEPLVIEYYGAYYPSLALLAAAKSLNLGVNDITVELGRGVKLGGLTIRTDDNLRMYSGFYRSDRNSPPFPTYSFYDVLNGKVPMQAFSNKIVLIGATAAGIGDTRITPVSHAMSGPELTANAIASILNQDFYTSPSWTTIAEVGIYIAILLYLMLALPSMTAAVAGVASLAIFIALIGSEQYLLIEKQLWLGTAAPALMLLLGHLLITSKRFFVTERLKVRVEADSAQTNRMLGLSFQGQGQLDMAMDKFRTLPVDDSVLDLVYNLALDFERKRQLNKAVAAYDYVLQHNDRFRDAAERRKRAQQADSTIVLGGSRSSPGGTLLLDGTDQKPTLGRYEIEREIGKGAMGAVYLGRDPRINRVVAIKTMALSHEFAAEDLQDVKTRFFREAETAGRLNHPNIVTIYDAGEDQDLAYIAMEYLQGRDLGDHVRPDRLLPPAQVIEIVSTIAGALNYAHTQGVVHRDIKPANIMYDRAAGAIKVTDFGIARITASSRTRTGVILGTPSYMSPEQLAGKHVDGRSDLFSLGVMAFELLTGRQPFHGDSMATLMFQIANERHPDITTVRTDLPTCLRSVIDKALHKSPEKRYQTGDELNRALAKCLRTLTARNVEAE